MSTWSTKAKNTSIQEREIAPPGTHMALCVGLIDLGTHTQVFNGKRKDLHKILLCWELPQEMDSSGEPFVVQRDFSWSLHKKSRLRPFVESWLGRNFAEDEEYELIDLLRRPCVLSVTNGKSAKGFPFDEVTSVGPLMKGMECPGPFHKPFAWAISMVSSASSEPPVPNWVPPLYGRNVVDDIKSSKEWESLSEHVKHHANWPAAPASTHLIPAVGDEKPPF